MTYNPQWYRSPIDLPAARSGKVQVRHRVIQAGEEVPIVGFRQALLRGQRPVRGVAKEPLLIHELFEDGVGMWMTDLPEELNQIAEMLHVVRPRGHVLVGGLGLGIVASMVGYCAGVESITVVERSADIAKLCAPVNDHAPDGLWYRVEVADIRKYLDTFRERYDCYLLDTWTSTSEDTWWSEVMPLRRIIRRRWGRKPVVHCWAEDIMAGQILKSLMHTVPHWWYSYLPVPMPERTARAFVRDVGLPAWERRYGAAVDRYAIESEKRSAALS